MGAVAQCQKGDRARRPAFEIRLHHASRAPQRKDQGDDQQGKIRAHEKRRSHTQFCTGRPCQQRRPQMGHQGGDRGGLRDRFPGRRTAEDGQCHFNSAPWRVDARSRGQLREDGGCPGQELP